MALYSYTDDSLSLVTTPRLEKIAGIIKEGKELEREDLEYLLNESARWTTLQESVRRANRKGGYEVNAVMHEWDGKVNLSELLGEILTETQHLYYVDFDAKTSIYRHKLRLSEHVFGKEPSTRSMVKNIRSGIAQVKNLQKDFDKNDDGFIVEGYFPDTIKYGYNVTITKDSDEEELVKGFLAWKKERVDKIIKQEQEELQIIEQLQS